MGRLTFQNPAHEPAEKEWLTGGNIVPVYPLTEGLQPLLVRRVMKRVSEYWSGARARISARQRHRSPTSAADRRRACARFTSRARRNRRNRRAAAWPLMSCLCCSWRCCSQRQIWRGEPAPELRAGEPTLDRLYCGAAVHADRRATQRRSACSWMTSANPTPCIGCCRVMWARARPWSRRWPWPSQRAWARNRR